MKNINVILPLFLSIILYGCQHSATVSEQNETIKNQVKNVNHLIVDDNKRLSEVDKKGNLDLRKVAWSSLSKAAKETVLGDWQEAELIKVSLVDVPQNIEIEKNQKVVKVIFHTVQDRFVGPIEIYLDYTSKRVIGTDLRM